MARPESLMRPADPRRSLRLLERIAAREQGAEPKETGSADRARVASLLAHLRRLLNTRRNSAPIDPDYGVPDFTNLSSGTVAGSLNELCQQIRQTLARYEPRLQNPEVTIDGERSDPLTIRLQIAGVIVSARGPQPLSLAARLAAGGHIDIGDGR